jgi:hypothetical protein
MTENGLAPAAPDDDRTPTQEDLASSTTKPADAWVMPEPVFRRSEGVTPTFASRGNEDETLTPDTLEPHKFVGGEEAPSEDDIAEQPDLAEDSGAETAAEPAASQPAEKKKSGFFKILMIVVGIALAVLVVVAAILVLGLGYFFRVSESQNLN